MKLSNFSKFLFVQGRQFDKDGNMRQWWTNKTISEYVERTECFIEQYDNYYIPEVEEHVK